MRRSRSRKRRSPQRKTSRSRRGPGRPKKTVRKTRSRKRRSPQKKTSRSRKTVRKTVRKIRSKGKGELYYYVILHLKNKANIISLKKWLRGYMSLIHGVPHKNKIAFIGKMVKDIPEIRTRLRKYPSFSRIGSAKVLAISRREFDSLVGKRIFKGK